MNNAAYRFMKKQLATQGIELKVDDGEFNVNFVGGCEATRAYDTDFESIIGTAAHMMQEGNKHTGCELCQAASSTNLYAGPRDIESDLREDR